MAIINHSKVKLIVDFDLKNKDNFLINLKFYKSSTISPFIFLKSNTQNILP